jgi:CheY-like chemotaxis protein/Tfp pilus assembly protein PilZ
MALSALIVCNDAEAVQVLGRILAERGVAVDHCLDMPVAIARAAEQRFAAIVVDCDDEDGAEELITAARGAAPNENTLIVALVDAKNEVRELFTQGANFLLYKPISLERASESLQAAWSLMPKERRQKRRVHVSTQASITFSTTEDANAPLLNLSEDGVALHSSSKMQSPCRVYFQFALPGQKSTVRLSGDVVWQDARGRVGLHFAQVPQASRRLLNKWLDENSAPELGNASATTLILQQSRFDLDDLKTSAAHHKGAAASDRRTQSRFNTRLGVTVSTPAGGVLQQCTLTDLSAGGCYVETTQPFNVGTAVAIEVRTLEMKLIVHGKVKSSHRGYGMGVEFNAKSAEEREHVKKLLAAYEPQLEIIKGFAGD